MKDKIFTFLIGLLVGAIITSGVFLIINKNKSNDSNQENQTSTERQMPEGMQGGPRGTGEEPPAKPGENSEGEENMEEPPTLPDGENEDSNRPTKPSTTTPTQEDTTNETEE